MDGLLRIFAAAEAVASRELDRGGTCTVLTHPMRPRRERPGFGCPHCGESLALDARTIFRVLVRDQGLECCGYAPEALELVRWLRAARLLAAGASAH